MQNASWPNFTNGLCTVLCTRHDKRLCETIIPNPKKFSSVFFHHVTPSSHLYIDRAYWVRCPSFL